MGALVVAVLLAGGCALREDEPSAGDPTINRAAPAYARSDHPSGLVVRLPGGDVDLPADTSCWSESVTCRRALLPPGATGPDLGTQDAIEFWSAQPGGRYQATFRRLGEDCPRATTVDAVATGDRWFRLDPAGAAGEYVVDLEGEGVSTRFVWTTTADGPVDAPAGSFLLVPESLGKGSYALEVMVEDLAFQPAWSELSPTAAVTVTAAGGRDTVVQVPLVVPSLECGSRGYQGSFYYQGEWRDDVAVLGRAPYDVRVDLTIRGTTYTGAATWYGASRAAPYVPVTFTPPLPAAGAP